MQSETSTVGLKPSCIFISYSWTSPSHVRWVIDLATRLTGDGIKVIIDQWDLKPGQDKYEFMESMVKSPEIDKVLIICNESYCLKAEERQSGVGTETQIIAPEVYEDVAQEKFIPIVAQRDEQGKEFVPTYIKSRIYIDLSSPEVYEAGYEQLLRNLHNQPLHRRPELGKPPAWLFTEEKVQLKTHNINRQIEHAIFNHPERVEALIYEFRLAFFEELEKFRVDSYEDDNQIYELIKDMLPLRDTYIKFIEQISLNKNGILYIDSLISFLEELHAFSDVPVGVHSWSQVQFDQFKFLIRELFLYTIIVLYEKEWYSGIASLLNNRYFVKKTYRDELVDGSYGLFDLRSSTMEVRNERLRLNKISLQADMIIQRANHQKYTKQKIVQADLLLYYVSVIQKRLANGEERVSNRWFPMTYVYEPERKLDFFVRLQSKRHFNKVKDILNVSSPEQLKNILIKKDSDSDQRLRYMNSFDSVLYLEEQIDPEMVCKYS